MKVRIDYEKNQVIQISKGTELSEPKIRSRINY